LKEFAPTISFIVAFVNTGTVNEGLDAPFNLRINLGTWWFAWYHLFEFINTNYANRTQFDYSGYRTGNCLDGNIVTDCSRQYKRHAK
jgi:hypothetical protein